MRVEVINRKEKRQFRKEKRKGMWKGANLTDRKYYRVTELTERFIKETREDFLTYCYAGDVKVDKETIYLFNRMEKSKKYNSYDEWEEQIIEKYKTFSIEELRQFKTFIITKKRKDESQSKFSKEIVFIFATIILTSILNQIITLYFDEYEAITESYIGLILYILLWAWVIVYAFRFIGGILLTDVDKKYMYTDLEVIIEQLITEKSKKTKKGKNEPTRV